MTDWDELSPLEIDNQRLRADCAKLETAHRQNMREIDRLRTELAAALQDAQDLNVEVEHYANLAIVDLGANPTVSWMERAEAAEAERDALRAQLAEAREALKWIASHHLTDANDVKDNYLQPLCGAACVRRARAALARIDAALKGDDRE